jgi:apolipoprotein N-acyltransferase
VVDIVVLAVGVLLSVLALPNEVFTSGWGFLGPVALVPVFWVALRRRPWVSALAGALWVAGVTLLSQSWLLSFHPLALPLVLLFQVPWYAAAFAVASWTGRRTQGSPWALGLAWTVFEFVRVQGFFAYPYGALATAFWAYPATFQSADLVGTSGLTLLLAWSSAWVAVLVSGRRPWTRLRFDLAAGLGLWSLNLGYGVWRLVEPAPGTSWRPALVQQSQDPWKGGAGAYEAGFETLSALSDRAEAAHPDVVVWSETAFVPSVAYHEKYRDNPDSLQLVRRLEDRLKASKVPYLLGNDHREKSDTGAIEDYNAVLAWDGGWVGRYEKNRLVPFTESFPYKGLLPGVYQMLLDADTHFWQPGRGHPVLRFGGVTVGTPVCFEDAFPDGARDFAAQGAQVLVNLTNDAWAPGKASRMQHFSLAVFRSVETRLPLVRAANDGATAAVSSRGEVLGLLPVGPPGVLQAEVKLGRGTGTLYTWWGDWFPWVCGVLWACCLVFRGRRSSVDKAEQL